VAEINKSTEMHTHSDKIINILTAVMSVLLICSLWLYSINSKNIRKLREESRLKFRLLDIIPNMVTVTDGKDLVGCNNRVLDFTGYKAFSDFKAEHKCLCDYFIEEEGYISQRTENFWLWEVFENEEKGLASKVKMYDKSIGCERIFLVSYNEFDPSEQTIAVTFTDISETERFRKKIEESEKRFRLLFNGHSAPMFLVDPISKKIIDVNVAAANFYGYDVNMLKGMDIGSINVESDVYMHVSEAAHRKVNHFEFRHRLASGEIREVDVYSSPVEMDGNTYLFSIISDITDKKIIEREFKKQSDLFSAILMNAPLLVWFIGADGNLKFANSQFCAATGADEKDVLNVSVTKLKTTADISPLMHDSMEAMLGDNASEKELSMALADGKKHILKTVQVKVKSNSGMTYGLVCIATDITEQKHLENDLRRVNENLSETVEKELAGRIASEMKLRGIFNSLGDALFIYRLGSGDSSGAIIEANASLFAMTGFSKPQILAKKPDDLLEITDEMRGIRIHELVSEGKHIVYKSSLNTASGAKVEVEVSCTVISLDGTPTCITTLRDIRRIIRLEQEKEESDTLVEATFSSVNLGIGVFSDTGTLIKVNSFFCRIFGYIEKELIGKHISRFIPERMREQGLLIFSNYVTDEIDEFPSGWIAMNSRGEELNVHVTSAKTDVNNKRMLIMSVQDVTKIKEMESLHKVREQLLIQQSKMAAMGEMLGVIAHQWKQPLNIIYLIAQYLPDLLEEEKFNGEELIISAAGIVDQVEFLNDTMNDFRNFFKPAKEAQKFNVGRAVRYIVKMLLPQLQQNDIDIQIIENHDVSVFGYENEFKQVIMNLITNARDAIAEFNKEFSYAERRLGVIAIAIEEKESFVEVTVSDNGGGIDEGVINDIFKPYISTKGEGGTGIGLSMSKTIIEDKMNGSIRAVNIESGARFIIELPR
jgi:PAS domain S-box-containing protein